MANLPVPASAAPPPFRVIACPRPFSAERVELELPAGATIAEILDAAGVRREIQPWCRVFVGDSDVPAHLWGSAKPKPGTIVTVRAVPTDGVQGGGKDVLRIVGTIAIAIAAAYTGGAAAGALGFTTQTGALTSTGLAVAAGISAGVTILGTLALSALIPPPGSKLSQLSDGPPTSPALSLTGTQNRANPFGVVPRVFGRVRMFPFYAAKPFTETIGSDQYLRLLFDFGYGPLNLSDMRIGSTPLSNFEGVETEVRGGNAGDAPITLFSNTVFDDAFGLKVSRALSPQVVESRDGADEITFDLTFEALVQLDTAGNRQTRSVDFYVEYKKTTATDWLGWTGGTAAWFEADVSPAGATGIGVTVAATTLGGTETESVTYTADYRKIGAASWTPFGTFTETVNNRDLSTGGEPGGFGPVTVTHDFAVSGLARGAYEVRVTGVRNAIQQRRYLTDARVTVSAATDRLYRQGFRKVVGTNGRYQLRFQRVTPDTDSIRIRDDATLTALRTIRYQPPVNVTGHCLVAMRIKATDQLNGIVDQFNAIAQAILPVWNGTTWSEQETRSPAWAFCDVFMGTANRRRVTEDRMDLAAIKAWADACAAAAADGQPKWTFDAVIDYPTTVFEMARDIAASARAAFAMPDGKFSVVRDVEQSVPAQHFTPRNSWGFRATKTFVELPHAIRARYIDPDREWSQQEVTVYADGQSASTATRFETLEAFGVTRPNQAWREARYHMAVAQLRPETYEFNCDAENLVCTRGDLIRVAHDVPLWGSGWGRVKSVTRDGDGKLTAIALDERVVMEAGKLYAVRVRASTGESQVFSLSTVAGESATLTLLAATTDDPLIGEGDLAMFGEADRESVALLVQRVIPGPDKTARLVCVDAAPAVHQADTGAIPPFDAQITLPVTLNRNPDKPAVTSIVSDESALVPLPGGQWLTRILITLAPRSGLPPAADLLRVQYRRTDSGEAWSKLIIEPPSSVVEILGPDDATRYDIRLRAETRLGRASDWTAINGYLVVGKSTPPADVPDLYMKDGLLHWRYPDAPRDLSGFRVLYNLGAKRARPGATLAHPGLLSAPPFDTSVLPSGLITLLVVAVDAGGNESASPAILVRDLGDPEIANVIDTVDLAAAGFAGTITGGTIVDGELIADAAGDIYLPADDAAYLPGAGALYLPGAWGEVVWEFDFIPGVESLPSRLTIDADIAADTWAIELRNPSDGLYLADAASAYLPDAAGPYLGTAGSYIPWPGEIDATRLRYRFRVTLAGGNARGTIAGFTMRLDVPDEEEELEDVTISAAGTRLPITGSYRSIRSVGLTLQDDGGTAVKVTYADKQTTIGAGPLIKAYDAAGALTTATIDARIKGARL